LGSSQPTLFPRFHPHPHSLLPSFFPSFLWSFCSVCRDLIPLPPATLDATEMPYCYNIEPLATAQLPPTDPTWNGTLQPTPAAATIEFVCESKQSNTQAQECQEETQQLSHGPGHWLRHACAIRAILTLFGPVVFPYRPSDRTQERLPSPLRYVFYSTRQIELCSFSLFPFPLYHNALTRLYTARLIRYMAELCFYQL
jgi:hypothetical protein